MGLSIGVLFVERAMEDIADSQRRILGSFTGELARLGDFLSNLPRQQFAIAQLASWAVILDPRYSLFDESFAISAAQRTLWISLNSIGNRFGFTYLIGGKEVRRVLYVNKRPTMEIGTPLAEEAGIQLPPWGYDQEWAFTVVKRLTGIQWAELESSQFALMEAGPPPHPVVQKVVTALARVPPDESTAKDSIFLAFADPDPKVREAALRTVLMVASLTDADLERIREMEMDPDQDVARSSDIALRNIRPRG